MNAVHLDSFQCCQFDPDLTPNSVRRSRRAALRGGRYAHLEQMERAYRVERIYHPLEAAAASAEVGLTDSEDPNHAAGDLLDVGASAARWGISISVKREQFYARVTARYRSGWGQYEEISGNLSYGQMRAFPRSRKLSGEPAAELVRLLVKHEARSEDVD